MECQRRSVTKRVGIWGSVYIIGGTEINGETLPLEQADDLITRFEHDQALFARTMNTRVSTVPLHTGNPHADF